MKKQKQQNRAMTALVRACQRDLMAFLSRRAEAAKAEELAQETFLAFTKGEYDPLHTEARAILFGIAHNKLKDHFTALRKNRELPMPDQADSMDSTMPSPEKIAITKQELNRMMAVIKALPPQMGRVFMLSRIYGLKHAEISEEMNIAVSTVEKHMKAATLRILLYKDRVGNKI